MKGEQMMMTNEKMKINGCTPIEDLITEDFGAIGTPERDEFERGCEAFIIGEQIESGHDQEQLAAKIGTKKSYISRIENGHADIQLSTLFKIYHVLYE
ncbi:helix-turn-helix domain-containing protein [Bacteroides thetaiotaomicron]|uniref:helix-turn-helix domain-containing protein n=1 Tax=Bacteroides thetaiotaomicron TaxID=818 RepID=UPI0034A19F03